MTSLIGKIAIVTGAGRGTGRTVALALGQAGARVAVVDVNPDTAQQTAEALTEAGHSALALPADIANKLAIQTVIYTVLDQWERVDLLVNAAHIAPTTSALTLDEWEWNRVLDVNLKGVFLTSQTVARAMSQTGGGWVFNLMRPDTGSVAVAAARGGLLALTTALVTEWGPLGVRMQAVSPDQIMKQILDL
jgi:NAD(P)-dependent dehydrogenase (short-subunit alcohol dehydrogenase family)